jgi:hypothetical protein
MHYITGTSFSIKPDPKRGYKSKETAFSVNTLYRLITIKSCDTGLQYNFIGVDKSNIEMQFNSAREADLFIAGLRNEILPDYDARYASRSDDI